MLGNTRATCKGDPVHVSTHTLEMYKCAFNLQLPHYRSVQNRSISIRAKSSLFALIEHLAQETQGVGSEAVSGLGASTRQRRRGPSVAGEAMRSELAVRQSTLMPTIAIALPLITKGTTPFFTTSWGVVGIEGMIEILIGGRLAGIGMLATAVLALTSFTVFNPTFAASAICCVICVRFGSAPLLDLEQLPLRLIKVAGKVLGSLRALDTRCRL